MSLAGPGRRAYVGLAVSHEYCRGIRRANRKRQGRILNLGIAPIVALRATAVAEAQASFDQAEHLKAAGPGGKKKGEAGKGAAYFDTTAKTIEFREKKAETEFTIPYGSVKTVLYERASKPR